MISAQTLESSDFNCTSSYCEAQNSQAKLKATRLSAELQMWRQWVNGMTDLPTNGQIWQNTQYALNLVADFSGNVDRTRWSTMVAGRPDNSLHWIADNIDAITSNLQEARKQLEDAEGVSLPTTTSSGTTTGPYVQGTNFNCTKDASPICYAIGKDVERYFVGVQAQANRLADKLGFAKLKTDGYIGSKTVAAMKQVVNYVGSSTPALQAFVANPTKEVLSAYARIIYDDLVPILNQNNAPVGVAYTPGGSGASSASDNPSGISPYIPSPKSNTLYWVIGGVAAAALVGVGVMVWKKRKQNRSSFKPAEPAGRKINANVVRRSRLAPAHA